MLGIDAASASALAPLGPVTLEPVLSKCSKSFILLSLMASIILARSTVLAFTGFGGTEYVEDSLLAAAELAAEAEFSEGQSILVTSS